MSKRLPKHLIPVMSLFSAIILLLTMNFTTPAGVGPLGVLVFFTACYMLVLGISVALVKLFRKLMGKPMGNKGYLYAAIIAFGPIMILLVQSLGSLTPLTIVLVVLLILLVCFLVSKTR